MAKTNPIGVRFRVDVLEYVKTEHGIDSPQKALVFYERFFVQHQVLAKDIKQVLRVEKPAEQEKKAPPKQSELKNSHILARIAEVEQEMKSPPKNPLIGLKMWLQVRQNEINDLKKKIENE